MEKNKEKENDKHICRALITPSDGVEYDFEAVAVPSENGQIRYGRNENGDYEYFNQILRTKPENVDTSRMESGLPMFDNHPWDTSAMNTLGITVGYAFDDRGIVVRCKFGARADEALRNDVKNGIIKTVSIEGMIQNYSVERNPGQIPNYYADLWTPESLSFAPVPQDIGAQIEVKRKIADQIKNAEIKTEETKTGLSALRSKFKKD